MIAAALAVAPAVAEAIAPTPLYGHQRPSKAPKSHAWLYAGNDSPAAPSSMGQTLCLMYVHLWAPDFEVLDELEGKVAFLDGHRVAQEGDAHGLRYRLASVTRVPEASPEGGWHATLIHEVLMLDARKIPE